MSETKGMWQMLAIPHKPMILGVLGIIIFVTGIIAMGTGIQTGRNADGYGGYTIGMAVMTGLMSFLVALFAVAGGIFRIFPSLAAAVTFIACLLDLVFTWMGAGSVGAGIRTSLGNAFLAFAIITGVLEILFLFLSVQTHVLDDAHPREHRREGNQDEYVDVESV